MKVTHLGARRPIRKKIAQWLAAFRRWINEGSPQ